MVDSNTSATPADRDGLEPRASSKRMCSDGRRSVLATAIGVAVPVLAGLVVNLTSVPGVAASATVVMLGLIGFNLFAVIYVVLTLRTFAPVDPDEFRARMAARTAMRSRRMRRISPGGDGPNFAVISSSIAFAVVLVVPHVHSISDDVPLLVPITLSILLSTWALSTVSYALHYAQYDLEEAGLEFPGERTNAFADYRYFSIAVATTFGATDVNITTPRMRRVVNLHTVLTFTYNTVIVALLVALLLR
jgi:uncharacterized membrane protein